MAISAQDYARRGGRDGYTPMQDSRDPRKPPVMGSYSQANVPQGMGAVDPKFASAQKSAQNLANSLQQNQQPRQQSNRQTFPNPEGPRPTGALQQMGASVRQSLDNAQPEGYSMYGNVSGKGMAQSLSDYFGGGGAQQPNQTSALLADVRGRSADRTSGNESLQRMRQTASGAMGNAGGAVSNLWDRFSNQAPLNIPNVDPVTGASAGASAGASTPAALPDNLLNFDGSNFGAASDRSAQTLIGGDSRPSGVRGDQNSLTRADGSRLYASDYGSNVNTMDMAGANSAMAEANAIRQRQIDAQPERRRGPQAPPDMASILANVDTTGKSASAGRAMRQGVTDSTIGAYESGQDRQMRERMGQQDNQNQLMMQQMRNEGTLDAARMGDEAAMERAKYAANTLTVKDIMEMMNAPDQTDEGRMYFEDILEQRLLGEASEGRSYAEGGLVEPVTPMGAMAGMGGEYGQAPQMPMQDEIQEYQRYAAGAQSMGIEAVSLEEFMAMREGAAAQAQQAPQMPDMMEQPQGALAFAEGGMVPDPMDASGSMVIDPDPMAGTDSIPAMIDGQVPAKLDSGEFVLPEDVTRFFGTKKLNDMIQQARSAMQEANASPGPAM